MPGQVDRREIEPFANLELRAKEVVEGFITGLHKSPFHGFSVEFAEYKPYNTGESTRHIDWKLYARSDKLFVRKYEEETNLRCQLVIDISSSMLYPEEAPNRDGTFNKLGFSIYASAAIMEMMKRQRDAVGLTLFDEGIVTHLPAKSAPAHRRRLFANLEQLLGRKEKGRGSSTAKVLHDIAESVHKRSLVIIFSDMLQQKDEETDSLFSALQHLRHRKHEVILFHTYRGKDEKNFGFENRPYTFVDMETGEEVKMQPSVIRKQYQRLMTDYHQNLKLKCGNYRIDYAEADIDEGFNHILLSYLIKRSKLY